MSNEIRVKVTKKQDRRYFTMYYDCPVTGKRHQRTTKTTTRRDAERQGAKWEAELREGRYKPASNILWAEFRTRYEAEVLPGLKEKTRNIVRTVFNAVEKYLGVARLRDLNGARLSDMQAKMRADGLAEASIGSYWGHLRAALRWAVRTDLMMAAPSVALTKRGKGSKMKGRAITAEEFDRMLDKVEVALLAVSTRKPAASPEPGEASPKRKLTAESKARHKAAKELSAAVVAPQWRRLLRGLWLGGLRLGEALNLSWDDERKICVDFSAGVPRLRIPAHLQKSGEEQLYSLAPEFALFLMETPEAERTGPVFPLPSLRSGMECRQVGWVSKVLSMAGEKANIVVNRDAKSGEVKFASAHDLRRSFGTRWAGQVMPAVLKDLMRHADIQTTMKFYVSASAKATEDILWKAAGVSIPVTGRPSATRNVTGEKHLKQAAETTCDGEAETT